MKTDSRPSTHPAPEAGAPGAGLTEFELLADERSAEALSDALLEAGALSVTVEDAEAQTESEQPRYAEPGSEPAGVWRRNRLRVLLGARGTPAELVALAAGNLGCEPPPIAAVRRVADQDWVGASQAQFGPLKVGRLWIVPSWIEPPEPAALNLRLDPGMAFGTGSHPSTRLCLLWLQANLRPGARVLDYGCGSGILAIAAARLGAGAVTGVDIDPLALAAARANSDRNQVRADYTEPGSLCSEGPPGLFDVVIANILAGPLAQLAPVLLGHLAPRGSIVLAGVLARQTGPLVDAYRAADPRMNLAVWGSDEDWVCLAGRRAGC